MNRKKPFLFIFLALGLATIVMALIFLPGCTFPGTEKAENSPPSGKIVFQWVKDFTSRSLIRELILMDGNGQNVHHIGTFTGAPAFSPNGEQIAIGCPVKQLPDSEFTTVATEICILNLKVKLDEPFEFPEETDDRPYEITARLSLPQQCWGQYVGEYHFYKGILSITWSPQADRLAVVCRDISTSEVCILSLSGETSCWDQTAAEGVYRIAWSPVDENSLVTGGGGYYWSPDIFLVNPDGSNKRFLAAGWSPEWSPDGSKIAYIEEEENITANDKFSVIHHLAVINPDGSGHKSLYQSDPTASETFISLGINHDFHEKTEANILAWSPDAKYIVFSGRYLLYKRLFRLDLETGEVIPLLNPQISYSWVTEPDWGP